MKTLENIKEKLESFWSFNTFFKYALFIIITVAPLVPLELNFFIDLLIISVVNLPSLYFISNITLLAVWIISIPEMFSSEADWFTIIYLISFVLYFVTILLPFLINCVSSVMSFCEIKGQKNASPPLNETHQKEQAALEICFTLSYNRILNTLKPYIKDERCKADIAAVLLIFFDISAINMNKDQQAIANILHPLATRITGFNYNVIVKRMSFYSEFIRHKQPRGDASNFSLTNIDDGFYRMTLAFCDIIHNHALIDDYDNGPVRIADIFEQLQFVGVIKNALPVEASFIADVMKEVNLF